MQADTDDDLLGTHLAEFMHDMRNPLSSLRGAAVALRDDAGRLPPLTRASLMNLVVAQAEQFEWLFDALTAMGGGLPARAPVEVDVRDLVAAARRAGRLEDAGLDAAEETAVVVDPVRLRVALQCVIGSGHGAEAAVTWKAPGSLVFLIEYADPAGWADTWQALLARRLLEQEQCVVAVREVGANNLVVEIALPVEDAGVVEDAG